MSHFSDVRVPASNIVGEELGWSQGWRILSGSGLDVEKLEIAAMWLVIASAVEDAWTYSEQRRQFGQAILHFQSIRHKLTDIQTQLHAARQVSYQAARLAN